MMTRYDGRNRHQFAGGALNQWLSRPDQRQLAGGSASAVAAALTTPGGDHRVGIATLGDALKA